MATTTKLIASDGTEVALKQAGALGFHFEKDVITYACEGFPGLWYVYHRKNSSLPSERSDWMILAVAAATYSQ